MIKKINKGIQNDQAPLTKKSTPLYKKINHNNKTNNKANKSSPEGDDRQSLISYPEFLKSQKAKDDYAHLIKCLKDFARLTRTNEIKPSKRLFGYWCGALRREGFEKMRSAILGYAQSQEHRQGKYNWNITALITEPSKIANWSGKYEKHKAEHDDSYVLSLSQEERIKEWERRRGD